ncbi:biotin transporter BioY [Prochlorococcus sp. MIT 1223]|uniref:biotin transporter BioY n=1 Tax=Prochlorococcus sp. MIT 1223 TaxID=3096217 RepID=UPI002A7560B6|nr:biotin transporter BioY [Prochlorococcus sp. MIT 1223]
MRAVRILSGAILGLMMILIGTMVPTGFLAPSVNSLANIISLKSSLQIPSVLVSGIVLGPRTAVLSSIAYLTIGLFYLPIFQGGGSIGYVITPGFGYLVGFIPAAFITGKLSQRKKKNPLIFFTKISIVGLLVIHVTGIINLILGGLLQLWGGSMTELIFLYGFSPFLHQLILCPAIALFSISIKKVLFIK